MLVDRHFIHGELMRPLSALLTDIKFAYGNAPRVIFGVTANTDNESTMTFMIFPPSVGAFVLVIKRDNRAVRNF